MAQFIQNGSINSTFRLILDTWEIKQYTTNNYTQIGYRLSLQSTGDYSFALIGSTITLNIAGTEVYNKYSQKDLNKYSTIVITEGEIPVYHEDDGSKKMKVSATYTQTSTAYYTPGNMKLEGETELTKINRYAKLIDAEDFTDEGNPTITYNNPAGNKVKSLMACISLTGAKDDIAYRDVSKTDTTYTFELTDEEREVLRNAASNSKKINIKFYLKTTLLDTDTNQDVVFYSKTDKTMSIVNANPIFENFDYVDTNTEIAGSLTLDRTMQTFVESKSNALITISTLDKATAQKGAKMAKYRLVIGNSQVEADYKENEAVTLEIKNITSPTFTVYAIDSRGNSTMKQITLSQESIDPPRYIPYKELNEFPIIATALRENGVSKTVNLTVQGNYSDSIWIAYPISRNHIYNITYQYRKTKGGTWIEGETLLPTTDSSGSYTFKGAIKGDLGAEGFSVKDSFDIKIIVKDALSTREYETIIQSGEPNMAIHRDGVSFGAPYNTESGGPIQINGINIFEYLFPIGYTYISFSDVDPSLLFGGTWQQIKDVFLLAAGDNSNVGEVGGTTDLGLSYITSGYGIQAGSGNFEDRIIVGKTGMSQSYYDNHLPPHITVYVWRKIA